MQNKKFIGEVWLMWREMHGFATYRLFSMSVWIAAFGLIPSIITAIYSENVIIRPTMIGLSCAFVVLLLVSLFKAASKVWQRDTKKLSLIENQAHNPSEFINVRFSNLCLCRNKQIRVDLEWFNGTVFEMHLMSVMGNGKINDNELPHISQEVKRPCSAGKKVICSVWFSDKEIAEWLNNRAAQGKPVNLLVNLSWRISISEINYAFSKSGPQEPMGIIISQEQ